MFQAKENLVMQYCTLNIWTWNLFSLICFLFHPLVLENISTLLVLQLLDWVTYGCTTKTGSTNRINQLNSTKPSVTNTTVHSTVKEVSILMQECQTYQKYFEYIYTFWLGWNLLHCWLFVKEGCKIQYKNIKMLDPCWQLSKPNNFSSAKLTIFLCWIKKMDRAGVEQQ